ncbi:MAG: 50S ribosomal protein L11 [Alphaproteobacteria bacterium CG_4_9_14_3_um_filter_47_13]|nr:MAG: 50S ribosomal protein L11 [Alphaproteobacteria bacterium CG_4_9_14_3_um_filter_47_13]
MAKKIKGYIKLTITGGAANPSPPVGPALGQKGVAIMDFCNAFNKKTEDSKGIPIPVIITVYEDRSFDFICKKPPASYYIKKAAKLKVGSKMPGRDMVATLGMKQIRQIAEEKMEDLNAHDIDAAARIIVGSARSMGVEVLEG